MSYNEDKTEWKIGGGYVPKNDAPGNYIIRDGSGWKTYIDETKMYTDIMEHHGLRNVKVERYFYLDLIIPSIVKQTKKYLITGPQVIGLVMLLIVEVSETRTGLQL